jgi:hypothetical protein
MSVIEDIRPQAKADLHHVRMLIDGSWVDSLPGVTLTVENPAQRSPIATIPRGDAADVTTAVETERTLPLPGARWHRATAVGSCSASPPGWRLSRGSHAPLCAAHALDSGWVQVNHRVGQAQGTPTTVTSRAGIGREFSLEGGSTVLHSAKT